MRYATLTAFLILVLTRQTFASTTPAVHAQRTATVSVRGSVATTCTLTTAPFSFTIGIGYIHAPGNTILKQTALGVKCTKGAQAQIGMNYGLYGNAAGSQFGRRSMKDSAGDLLGYELCHDNACATVWQPSGFQYVSPNDKGSSLPVWTRITSGQSKAKQGSYSDAVTVTISF